MPPMTKLTVRVDPEVAEQIRVLYVQGSEQTPSDVIREALALGLKKMRKNRKRRRATS